ncbi:unnamed protein product [Rhizophagus irregularis]|nr:unnamed protein product [Rhizophagus irregularis]
MPEPYKFREFFMLIANPNNKSNAKAVCNYCSAKYGGVQAAALISGCSVTNKANLCCNHLANYSDNDDNPPPKRHRSSVSTVSSISSASSSNKQTTLTSFYRRPMSSKDTPTFETLVVKMCISNGLPFSFVENEETQAVFNFVAPDLKLPNRKKLGGKLLLNTSDNFQKNILKIAQSDEFGLTATFDGWTNVKQENIWGVVLITSKGQPLIWGAHETSSKRSRTEDVMRHIEQLIDETENKNIYIKAFISDSAGNLRDEQKRIYNKTIQLISPGNTRWNSYYFCFHSLLKTQAALKFLSAKFNPDRTNINCTNGIPSITANKKSKRSNGERKLPDDIADSINDAEFWKSLFSLQNLLYPLCGFLNKLQKDTARLYEVVHCFAYTTKIFSEYYEPEFSEKIVLRMESRWKDWEQPLLLLSIALHPSYKLSKFRSTHKKVLAMSQICSDILYQRRIKEVNQTDQQMKRLHIATPIASDDLDYLNDEPLQNIDEEFLIVSDDEDVNNAIEKDIVDEEEPSTEENENQWSSIISQWIEEANFENRVEDSNDENFLNDDLVNDFSVGMRNIHPADDTNAKWQLSTLFISILEPPTYTGFF